MNNGYTNKALGIASQILFEEFGEEYDKDSCNEVATRVLNAVAKHVDFGNESDTMTVQMDNTSGMFIPEPVRHELLGFQLIHEMTSDELLEEAIAFQRGHWARASKNQLKAFVIEARMHLYKERLKEEAWLDPEGFNFGSWVNNG